MAFLPDAEVVVTLGAETILTAELTLTVLDGGPLAITVSDARLAITELTVDGKPAGVMPQGNSLVLVGAWASGTHVVRYTARVKATSTQKSGRIELLLPPAARSTVRVASPFNPDLDIHVAGAISSDGDRFAVAARGDGAETPVTVSWRPRAPAPARQRRVRVDQHTALSVDEAEVRALSFLQVRVEHGALDTLPLRIPGGAEAVEVLEPAGAVVEGSGEQLTIRMSDPITDLARVVVRYRSAAPGEDGTPIPIPLRPGLRGDHTVAILRTDDAVVIPTSGSGTALAFADLPAELRSSLPGTPVAAFSGVDPSGTGFQWRRLETTPAAEPPIIVDHARYEASFAESGTGAIRATWQVRNDRAPFLPVRLPEGWTAVSVRVAGRPVALSRTGNTLLIPLEKSTETLAGRVQLPVELSAVGPGQPWVKRGWQSLEGPAVDAPVSLVEWQVNLPPGREARQTEGARPPAPIARTVDMGAAQRLDGNNADPLMLNTVDTGAVLGGTRGAKKKEARGKSSADAAQLMEQTARKRTSTAYWSAAYDAYKDNRFDEAEELLDRSVQLDPNNVAAQQLQSNMVIVNSSGGSSASGADEAVARRVKAMARAKADRTTQLQDELAEEALRAEQSGDFQAASSAYRKLAKTTEKLAILEEDEAVEQKRRLTEVEQKLTDLKEKTKTRSTLEATTLEATTLETTTFEAPEEEESANTGALTRDFPGRVPAGRSYNAAVEISASMGTFGAVLNGAVGEEADPAMIYEANTEIDFEGLELESERVMPQGAKHIVTDGEDIDMPFFFDDIEPHPEDLDVLLEPMPTPDEVQTRSRRVAILQLRPAIPPPPSRSDIRQAREQRQVDRADRAQVAALHRAPRPPATPGMTPLPAGVTAARGDIALPVAPDRLLHVEQQLLPAGAAATFDVRIRTRDL